MLNELHGATIFTKLDLSTGYHQVQVHPPDIPKTTFHSHSNIISIWLCLSVPCNAPSIFQSLMNSMWVLVQNPPKLMITEMPNLTSLHVEGMKIEDEGYMDCG